MEYAQSDRVDKLVAQTEEAVTEVAKVEAMLQELQEKVCIAAQPESALVVLSCA